MPGSIVTIDIIYEADDLGNDKMKETDREKLKNTEGEMIKQDTQIAGNEAVKQEVKKAEDKTKKQEVNKAEGKTKKQEAKTASAVAAKPKIKLSMEMVTGPITDDKISVTATTAMALFIMSAAIMAVAAMYKKSIDFIMNTYPDVIKFFIFPLMGVMVFGVYLMVIGKMRADGVKLVTVLKKNPVFIIFAAATILILYSQYYNGFDYAVSGYCAASIQETFLMELSYFVFVLFGATQVRKESHKRFLLRMQILVSALLVIAAFALWHTLVESSFFYDWTPRFSSIFSNTNYYGYYLALSVPLAGAAFLYEKGIVWKVIAFISFAANSVALSLCGCRGGWIGAGLAMVFIAVAHLIIEKKINWQSLVLIVVFAICLFVPSHVIGTFEGKMSSLGTDIVNIVSGSEDAANAGSYRWMIWRESLKIANENAPLGIGFEGVGHWGYQGPPYNVRPHNEFIQYAMFHGYPMMILYFIGCLGIFIRALRKKTIMNGATLVSLAAAFGYLVNSFFGLTVFSTAAYLFIFLGMGYVRDSSEK
ncbi:MAG: O-antigen ligase family protein [Lachnospiraceae bacterium]|nr:O-antigen ligase family protein [Lachnospiraceae bacterium]